MAINIRICFFYNICTEGVVIVISLDNAICSYKIVKFALSITAHLTLVVVTLIILRISWTIYLHMIRTMIIFVLVWFR